MHCVADNILWHCNKHDCPDHVLVKQHILTFAEKFTDDFQVLAPTSNECVPMTLTMWLLFDVNV